ncbi:MAG: hypothetical protein AAGG01_17370, partial [Planctomycetota bacterium]
EGDWLGTTALHRGSLVASAFSGAALGAVVLVCAVGATVHAIRPGGAELGDAPRLELSATGGPERSVVLHPTESFTLPLGVAGAPAKSAARGAIRVRATVTIGADAPTTRALIERLDASGRPDARSESPVARRTWLEIDHVGETHAVRVTNVGSGALAILGPAPVQVWEPSSAWLNGTPRALAHAAAWILTLAAGALALGVVMGPGIAAALSFSLWLGAWLIADLTGGLMWLPGGPAAARALDAIADGRVPSAPPAALLLAAVAAFSASCVIGTGWLRSWRDEVRG